MIMISNMLTHRRQIGASNLKARLIMQPASNRKVAQRLISRSRTASKADEEMKDGNSIREPTRQWVSDTQRIAVLLPLFQLTFQTRISEALRLKS